MSLDLALVLGLLAVAIVMFARNKPRMDAAALLMLVALPLTGVITMNEALAGFADPNVVLIAALFIVGDGLVRTGVAQRLGDWLTASAGRSETRLVSVLMLVVCGLGATMSSTAVTAIFIPVTMRIAQRMHTSPRRLMMPLCFAALISGMTTLIATAPNLVVNSELIRNGEKGFGFFEFTPFGLPVLALGILYMLVARNWLMARAPSGSKPRRPPTFLDWIDQYKLTAREHRVRVRPTSSLTGIQLGTLKLRDSAGASVLAVERDGVLLQPMATTEIHANDILFIDLRADCADGAALRQQYDLEELPLAGSYFMDRSQTIGVAEVIIPDASSLVGETVLSSDFRARFGVNVVGLRRGASAIESEVRKEPLAVGDTLLVIGPWKSIRRLQSDNADLVAFNLPVELEDVLPAPDKAPHALFSLAVVVALMISGAVPNVQAALFGCILMGILGCVDMNSAYRAIDWKTIVLIVGMLPFSTALGRTGGVQLAADGLVNAVGDMGTYPLLAALFAATTLLGTFISNTATAVLMAPVSIAIARDLGASPYPFAMIIALASSTAFVTPVSSPVNILVVSPGNYTFGDFLKVGVPFTLVVLILSVLLVPWRLPL